MFKSNSQQHNSDIKRLINYFAILVIYSDALVFKTMNLFQVRASYFMLAIIIAMMLPFIKKLHFSSTFIIISLIITGSSLGNVILGNDSLVFLSKQLLGISFSAAVFYLLIKFNNEDLMGLFTIYIKVAFIIAVIGLVQEIAYMFHIRPLFDFRYLFSAMFLPESFYSVTFYRVNSIMPEPTSFSIAMMPAFFIAFYSIVRNNYLFVKRLKCFVIVLSFFLSFSTTGYIGIFFVIILIILNTIKGKKLIIYAIIPILFIGFSYLFITDFRTRVGSALVVLAGVREAEQTNMSVFTFHNNAVVTSEVIKKSPMFGYGLGSHPISFQKSAVLSTKTWMPFLNLKDANSLFLRLLSETGIFGLACFIAFIIIFYVPKKIDKLGYVWLINNAILVLFLIRLIRQGHYFSEGFFFFFWVYYFSKKALVTKN